jgi:hypothetical protein
VYRGERVDLDCKWRLSDYVPRLLTEVRREMHPVFVSCWSSSIARRSRGVFL